MAGMGYGILHSEEKKLPNGKNLIRLDYGSSAD